MKPQLIAAHSVIAAVRSEEALSRALRSGASAVFLLSSDISSLPQTVARVKAAGKPVFVHMDFTEGLGKDKSGAKYLSKYIRPDGVITTKSALARYLIAEGMFVVQRFFMVDSQSFETAVRTIRDLRPDMAEVMPAVTPTAIRRMCGAVKTPIIAGGLAVTVEDVRSALEAGASALSTGTPELWDLDTTGLV